MNSTYALEGGGRRRPGPQLSFESYRLEPKGVIARRNHGERDRFPIQPVTEVFVLEPFREAGVANVGMAVPEAGI